MGLKFNGTKTKVGAWVLWKILFVQTADDGVNVKLKDGGRVKRLSK